MNLFARLYPSELLSFAHPWALAALLVIPLAAYLFARRWKKPPVILRVPSVGAAAAIRPSRWTRLYQVPGVFLLISLFLTIIGLSGPRFRTSARRDLSVEGIDIVVAFDLSSSMLAADFRPKDRITVAKDVLKRFIQSRQNDRIGLVVFAAEAYTQCPLTLDYSVLEELLDRVKTGVIQDGTAIGNALATAVNRLRESDAKSKVIILITDGDNNAGNISPIQAAQIAKELGIRVFTILIGKGGMVPYPNGTDIFGRTTYQQVEIDVNPELLQEIAQTTNGAYYPATDRQTLESGLQGVLDKLEKSKLYEAGGRVHYDEWYARLFLPAAFLGVLALMLRASRLSGAP